MTFQGPGTFQGRGIRMEGQGIHRKRTRNGVGLRTQDLPGPGHISRDRDKNGGAGQTQEKRTGNGL